jgi:hypothetical protein
MNAETKISPIGHNSGIAVYNEFRDQLADLENKNAKAAFDYEDPKGNKAARSHIYELRKIKGSLDRARKAEKAASLEYGRKVDAEAGEITTKIDAMIEVHQKPLDEIEEREAARIETHERGLVSLEQVGAIVSQTWDTLPIADMLAHQATVDATPTGADIWEEYADRAERSRAASLFLISDAIKRREKHDAEQLELANLRAAQAKREEEERQEQLRREGEARARNEAAAKAEQDRLAADKREADLKAKAEADEKARIAAEELAVRAKEDADRRVAEAERLAKEKAERDQEAAQQRLRDEQTRREQDQEHRRTANKNAVAAFVAGGMAEDAAKLAVTLIAQKAIPLITITY